MRPGSSHEGDRADHLEGVAPGIAGYDLRVEPGEARITGTTLTSLQRYLQAQHGDGADFAAPSAAICRMLVGWFRRSGQLTGAPDMKVWHPECRTAGKRACVWVVQW